MTSGQTQHNDVCTPFFNYMASYKKPGTKNTQSQRREQLLEAIKERRNAQIDEKRNIEDVFKDEMFKQTEEFEEGVRESKDELMETTTASTFRRKKKIYSNKLMLSEWFMEKPDDLETNWFVKVCMKGMRNLLVAHKGKTRCFSKTGHFICQFQSHLPGGSTTNLIPITILDCIYVQQEETFYVLDVLVWNSYSVISLTTEFRFFFVQAKLQEIDLESTAIYNEHKILNIPHKAADFSSIMETFGTFIPNVDGVLFYHKEISYLSQVTPLVGWLKVFMLPEVLQVGVHPDYYLERPEDYHGFMEYVSNFDWKREKRLRKQMKKQMNGGSDAEMHDFSQISEESSHAMES